MGHFQLILKIMTEKYNRPIRNTSRNVVKTIEWIAAICGIAVILENFGIVENISSVVANAGRAGVDFLPNLVDIVAHIPLPDFIMKTIAETKIAQDFNLLLNLATIWTVARLIATIFRLLGAQRSRVENIFGFLAKGIIVLILLSEGVKYAMGSETIDLFRGLIPFSTERGGDVPGWLANSNLREMAWAVSSSITSVFVGGWAYMSNIRPERKKKQVLEMMQA